MATPEAPKYEPTTSINWPPADHKGPKLGGEYKELGPGKRVCVRLDGICKGFGLNEYGGNLQLKVKTITVERVGETDDHDYDGPSMVDQMRKVSAKRSGRER